MNQIAHTHIDSGPLMHLIVSLGIAGTLAVIEMTNCIDSNLITAMLEVAMVATVTAMIEMRWAQRVAEQGARIEALRMDVASVHASVDRWGASRELAQGIMIGAEIKAYVPPRLRIVKIDT